MRTLEPVCSDHLFCISELAENYTGIDFNLFPLKWKFSLKKYHAKTQKCKIKAAIIKKWEAVSCEITEHKLKKDLRIGLTYKQQVGVDFGLQQLSFCESLMADLE